MQASAVKTRRIPRKNLVGPGTQRFKQEQFKGNDEMRAHRETRVSHIITVYGIRDHLPFTTCSCLLPFGSGCSSVGIH